MECNASVSVQLEGLKQLIQPNSGWRPNFATQLRAAAMQQLRGDKLAMKAALDLILWCAYGNKSRAFPGGPSAVLCCICQTSPGCHELAMLASKSKTLGRYACSQVCMP